MRTAIPTHFRLAGRTWKVVRATSKELDGLDSGSTLGATTAHDATIYLLSTLEGEDLESTFFHEWVHAMKATLGWEDNEDNHGDCDSLGGMIHQFLQTKKGRLT